MNPRTLLRAAIVLAAGTGLFACESGKGPQEDPRGPAEQLALWTSARPPAYAYTFFRSCFCPPAYRGPFLVEMEGGAVKRVRRVEDRNPQVEKPDTLEVTGDLSGYSMEAIFSVVSEHVSKANYEEKVEYHPIYGFPVSADFDGSESVADDEFSFRVSEFRKL